jgi:glycyl-tRNA synthetase beta chain
VPDRLAAVRAFSALPEAQSLAAANKRIANLLRKSGAEAAASVDDRLLTDPAERSLGSIVVGLEPRLAAHMQAHDYAAALAMLAQAREPVDKFFEQVMVMSEDQAVRRNRLALLARLHTLMNGVADISRLSVA